MTTNTNVQQRQVVTANFVSFSSMPQIPHPEYGQLGETELGALPVRGNVAAGGGAQSTQPAAVETVFQAVQLGLERYRAAVEMPPIMRAEPYEVPTCCGFCTDIRQRQVVDLLATENARRGIGVQSIAAFSLALEGIGDGDPKVRSSVHTSLGKVYNDVMLDDAFRRGHLERAGELNPDNIAARGAMNQLDKVEIHANLQSLSSVNVQTSTSVAATANASANATASVGT